MKRILVISSAESEVNTNMIQAFVGQLNLLGNNAYICHRAHYSNIGIHITHGKPTAFLFDSGEDITSYDFVYFKSFVRYEDIALAIATILKYSKIPFLCSEVAHGLSTSKISQYAILAGAGISLPKTMYIHSRQLKMSYSLFVDALHLPFIFKGAVHGGGEANYLVSNPTQYKQILINHPDLNFVAQSFIENEYDLRVLVVNDEIKLIIKRARKNHSTHLNNTSMGASASLLPIDALSPAVQDLSLRAARAMHREVAGVDVIFEHGTENVYILEVNSSPQIASGAFTEEKLSVFTTFFTEL